jgi:tripeptidyl-peptidase-1
MHRHLSSVLSVLAVFPLCSLAEPLSQRWNHMYTEHSWNAAPENWESMGCPPDGTTIDLYVGLKPYHENALIDALYEVSNPKHPRHVSSVTSPLMHELTSVAAPMQIRCIFV